MICLVVISTRMCASVFWQCSWSVIMLILIRLGWKDVVGALGIIKVIGLVIKVVGLGNGEVIVEGLVWFKCKLFKLGEVEKIDLDGIKLDCCSIFFVGLVILEVIFDVCDI